MRRLVPALTLCCAAVVGCLPFDPFGPGDDEADTTRRRDRDSGGEGEGEGETGCTAITPGAIDATDGSSGFYVAAFSPNLGGTDGDLLIFEFIDAGQGTHTFGSGDNANYATCTTCLTVQEDAELESGRTFFATEGTMGLSTDPLSGTLIGTLQGVRLVEVTIDTDSDSFTSTPVPGGACLTIASASLDSSVQAP